MARDPGTTTDRSRSLDRPDRRRTSRSASGAAALLVHGTQLAVLVVVIGGWQWLVGGGQLKVILFGQPSGIVEPAAHLDHRRHRGRLARRPDQGHPGGGPPRIRSSARPSASSSGSRWAGSGSWPTCSARSSRCSTRSRASCSARSSCSRSASGLESKILLVIVLVFFGVFFNAFQGAREVDRNFIANATILGASRWQVTRQVVLPSAFTWIIASLHVAFGFALIGAIVGEFIGGTAGLGVLISRAGHLRRQRRVGRHGHHGRGGPGCGVADHPPGAATAALAPRPAVRPGSLSSSTARGRPVPHRQSHPKE